MLYCHYQLMNMGVIDMFKILLVEDDKELNDGLMYDLKEKGYEIY